jgi:hypothetical protein
LSKVSIVIGFTPYHAYASRQIIDSLEGEVYCCFSKLWPETQRRYKRSFGTGGGGKLSNFIMFFIFSFKVKWYLLTKKDIDVYMPHPANIFTNYLFFLQRNSKRCFIYEDGLLNYYDAELGYEPVSLAKRVFALFCLHPYKKYSGHLAGYDAGSYDGAFLSMPDLAVRKESLGRLCRLEFAAPKLNYDEKIILFLDQNTNGRMTKSERAQCLEKMYLQYPPAEYKYYYKPHHDFNEGVIPAMTKLDAESAEIPAEMLVTTLRPKRVMSFYSSALINIKRCHSEIESISIAGNKVDLIVSGEKILLDDFFKRFDIKCL